MRNIHFAKKNFICITGNGFIHKGIDLILEAFSMRNDADLYLVGNIEDDIIIAGGYQDIIKRNNIHFFGFLDMKSLQFFEIASKCVFSINASCSEGCSTSILTSMYTGIIPIISPREGIDANGNEIILEEISIEGINKALDIALGLSELDIKNRMHEIARWTEVEYSKEAHFTRMYNAIKQCMMLGEE